MMSTPSLGKLANARTHGGQSPHETAANGSAAAAVLSAGAGSCVLGTLAVIADGSKTVAHWLAFYRASGPLSGVTTVAISIWLGIWFVLARSWRNQNVNLAKTNGLAFGLLLAALLLTFPPFGDLLLGK